MTAADDDTLHEQVKASRTTVDKDVAELLELWTAGIDTQYSCRAARDPGLHQGL